MKVKRVPIGDLKPKMHVWTPTQGWFEIIKLIRVFTVDNTEVYNWETTSLSRRLCGRRGIKVKTRG